MLTAAVAFLAAVTLLLSMAAASPADPLAPASYRMGVFPYIPVATIDRIYGPVAAQLAEDLGRPVTLKTKPTFEQFLKELEKESYDIVLVHPFLYVDARDKHQYLPLARLDEPLTAVVMVREDHAARTLPDLAGRKVALPPALSAVSELVKAALIGEGLKPDIDVLLEYYRSKSSCLQAVAIGRVDACGVPRFALSQIDPTNQFKLRPLFETAGVNNFVFAAHARVPRTDHVNLGKSILAWPYTARGRAILAGGAWTRFVIAQDSDYDDVRRYVAKIRELAQR